MATQVRDHRRFSIFDGMKLPAQWLAQCRTYLRQTLGVTAQDRLLIAVSGGMDSVLLCHLMHQLHQPFEVAHCNFQLRGTASDEDAAFVGALARQLHVPYHEATFNTRHSAKAQGVSIQIAARRLRYDWLSDLRRMQRCAYIATGHHLDDSIETALFQWVRGCGIRGLHGIPAQTDILVRPLSGTDRHTIAQIVEATQMPYREDASNATVKYTRNRLRHHVVPHLRAINPSLSATMQENFARIQQTEAVLDWAVAHWKEKLWHRMGPLTVITANHWQDMPSPELIAYEWLQPWGFTAGQVRDMLAQTRQAAGRRFESATHELLVDRGRWLVRERSATAMKYPVIELAQPEEDEGLIDLGGGRAMHWRYVARANWSATARPLVAALDADSLQWPLTVRHWQMGDKLAPIGMAGQQKKVSQLLKDAKLSLFEKEVVQVLCSGDAIAWVIGMRSSEWFKVTAQTRRVLVLEVSHKS